MSARFVWYVVGGIALVGLAVLLVLAYLWTTGRVSGVDNVTPSGAGQLAAYAGTIPSGGADPLQSPRSVSTDGSRLYVTEPDASRVSVFRLDGRFVRRISVAASGRTYPVDAAAISDSLFVVDTTGKRVLKLPVEGGTAVRVAVKLKQPTALASAGESLLIADASTGLWRMDVATGNLKRIADAQATSGFTGGIAIDGTRVLLADSGGSRVLDVALEGGDVAAFGERINLPRGIAVDGARRVWVADVFGGTVDVFDETGAPLGDIENEEVAGPETIELASPEGVAYAAGVNRLYVVDSSAGRVIAYTVAK